MDELNIVAGVARVVKLVAVVVVFVLWEVVMDLVVTVMLLALWVVSAVGISGMGEGSVIGFLVVRMVV